MRALKACKGKTTVQCLADCTCSISTITKFRNYINSEIQAFKNRKNPGIRTEGLSGHLENVILGFYDS